MNQESNTNSMIENNERKLTKEKVIELLKKYPDNTKPYLDYIKIREVEVQIGSREEQEQKNLAFLIEQAEILRDAGFNNEAYHLYYDALEMSNGKCMDEICSKIKDELAKL